MTPSDLNTESDLALYKERNAISPLQSYVSIRRVIRAMRGGSQSQLVEGDDNQFYVAKFMGNPQGSRTLVNELLCHRLINALDVSTADTCLLHLPPSAEYMENVFFQVGGCRVTPQAGLHLGSRCPVDPEQTAILNYLPARLLSKISNLNDFATMFVLDKWVHHVDSRQAVYTRDRNGKRGVTFTAYFIDNGLTFGGAYWQLGDAPFHGLAVPRSIYSMLDMRTLTRAATKRVEAIPAEVLQCAIEGIPGSWLASGDRSRLNHLLVELKIRREGLDALISSHLDALRL